MAPDPEAALLRAARKHRRLLDPIWVALGCTAVTLGVLGIFLPLLPTTPFLLLAAACFARGSPRMNRWLHTHPWFGDYLTRFEQERAVPLKVKVLALGSMWPSMAFAAWTLPNPWGRLGLLLIGLGVTVYLLRLKTLRAP